jgi:hypothetical protein
LQTARQVEGVGIVAVGVGGNRREIDLLHRAWPP